MLVSISRMSSHIPTGHVPLGWIVPRPSNSSQLRDPTCGLMCQLCLGVAPLLHPRDADGVSLEAIHAQWYAGTHIRQIH